MTRLPLSDIIRKIACEARDALDELLEKRGLAGQRQEFLAAREKFKKRLADIQTPNQIISKRLQARKDALDIRLDDYKKEVAAVEATLKADLNGTPDPKILALVVSLPKKYAGILQDTLAHSREVVAHNKALEAEKSAVSKITKQHTSKPLVQEFERYYNHSMAYSFRFRIIETDGVAASASWKLPAWMNGNAGSYTLPVSVGDTKERESDRNVKFVVDFEELHGVDCHNAPAQAGIIRSVYYPITGRIGVEEVIAQYFALLDRAKMDATKQIFAKTESYTDLILFTTTLTGSFTPSVVLNPTLREQFNGSLGISGARKDYHTVAVSLTAFAEPPPVASSAASSGTGTSVKEAKAQ